MYLILIARPNVDLCKLILCVRCSDDEVTATIQSELRSLVQATPWAGGGNGVDWAAWYRHVEELEFKVGPCAYSAWYALTWISLQQRLLADGVEASQARHMAQAHAARRKSADSLKVRIVLFCEICHFHHTAMLSGLRSLLGLHDGMCLGD